MFSMSRCVLRWGLIGAAGLGALAFVVGPERVAAGFAQVRATAVEACEDFVDDPVALRRQLASLAEKYPARIAEVRAEIGEVERQLSRLEQDAEVARRVVALTTDDLSEIRVALQEVAGPGATRLTSMRIGGRSMNPEQARTEARRIADVRTTYKDRLATDETQVAFLETQKSRLSEILDTLEAEHARYEAKLWQLDRQIDAIARNERLIEMTQEQQSILAEYDKFSDVGSLDQLESKLAELRTVQEAQLQTLSRRSETTDYERQARDAMVDDDLDLDDFWSEFDEPDTDADSPLALR
jgi:predicted RNase H-like nuclease (RuvC/YqgF family)